MRGLGGSLGLSGGLAARGLGGGHSRGLGGALSLGLPPLEPDPPDGSRSLGLWGGTRSLGLGGFSYDSKAELMLLLRGWRGGRLGRGGGELDPPLSCLQDNFSYRLKQLKQEGPEGPGTLT